MRLDPATLMDLESYERFRRAGRAGLVAHRRARSVMLGPAMHLQFEDEITVRYQVQEVLRAGRVSEAAEVAAESAVYDHLLPAGDEWTATLLIELPAPQVRRARMGPLNEAAHRVYLDVARLPRVFGVANEDLADRHQARPSAVHFLRFTLGDEARRAVLAGGAVTIGCAHDQYLWHRPLPPRTLALLRADLSGAGMPPRGVAAAADGPASRGAVSAMPGAPSISLTVQERTFA